MAIQRKEIVNFDKSNILIHLQDVAKKLNKNTLSVKELKQHGDIHPATVNRKFGGFSKALIAAGLKPNRIYKRDRETMLQELSVLMNQLNREPTKTEINKSLSYSTNQYRLEFGNLKAAFDVAETMTDCSNKRIEIYIPVKKNRRKYGEIINFRGMQHAPVNELGVVFLFGMLAHELNFRVESVQAGFPDCDAKYKLTDGTFEKTRIEFEFKSSNFKLHKHDPDKCDLIVCWKHDWNNCPLTVIELSKIIKKLDGD